MIKQIIAGLNVMPFLGTMPNYISKGTFDGLAQEQIVGYFNNIPVVCNVPLDKELSSATAEDISNLIGEFGLPNKDVDGYLAAVYDDTLYLDFDEEILFSII